MRYLGADHLFPPGSAPERPSSAAGSPNDPARKPAPSRLKDLDPQVLTIAPAELCVPMIKSGAAARAPRRRFDERTEPLALSQFQPPSSRRSRTSLSTMDETSTPK